VFSLQSEDLEELKDEVQHLGYVDILQVSSGVHMRSLMPVFASYVNS
jgi:hypothetical protein